MTPAPIPLSAEQARRFLLERHGLLGGRFSGEQGVMETIAQSGCVQFDPLDMCGRSHELALFSRVAGIDRDAPDRLLYGQRRLLDYFDKNLAIMDMRDWPCFERTRAWYRDHSRSRDVVNAVAGEVRAFLRERGSACARDLDAVVGDGKRGRATGGTRGGSSADAGGSSGADDAERADGAAAVSDPARKVDWYWSATSLPRAALETMYYRGELVIHHKRGGVKYYALAEDIVPPEILSAPDPHPLDADYRAFLLKRRIRAVGLLWEKPSDAFLGIGAFQADKRRAAYAQLLEAGEIAPIRVEGLDTPLYAAREDLPEVALAASDALPAHARRHVRFIAPLDCLMWDRKLIAALFGFRYTWEVYAPREKRQYGYYVIPVLYGERFAGRIELARKRDGASPPALRRIGFWQEEGFRATPAFERALTRECERLAAFLGLRYGGAV